MNNPLLLLVAFSLQSLHPEEHIKAIAGRHTDRAEADPFNPRLYIIPDERPAGVHAPAARKGQGATGYGEGAEMGFRAVYGVISEGDFSGVSRNPALRF